MGFVMLAISTMTSFGINAAIFGMVAHGLITGMLFFIAGSVQHNYGTREMSRLGGLLAQAPKMGWILGFCVMASLGLPGLAGLLGRVPGDPLGVQPGAPASASRCSASTWWSPRSAPCSPRATSCGCSRRSRSARPRPSSRHEHIHDVSSYEWTAWIPILAAHRRARHVPQHRVPRHRRRGHAGDRRDRDRDRVTGAADVLAASPPSPTRSSTGTRSRPTSSSSSTIAAVLLADLIVPDRDAWQIVAHRVDRRARRAVPVDHAGGDGARPIDVRRRVRRRPLRDGAEGLLPRRDLHHDPDLGRLHRRRRLLQGRVLRLVVDVGRSA